MVGMLGWRYRPRICGSTCYQVSNHASSYSMPRAASWPGEHPSMLKRAEGAESQAELPSQRAEDIEVYKASAKVVHNA